MSLMVITQRTNFRRQSLWLLLLVYCAWSDRGVDRDRERLALAHLHFDHLAGCVRCVSSATQKRICRDAIKVRQP